MESGVVDGEVGMGAIVDILFHVFYEGFFPSHYFSHPALVLVVIYHKGNNQGCSVIVGIVCEVS